MRRILARGLLALTLMGVASACGASNQALSVVRSTVDSVLRGDIDAVMANVGVPFASTRGTVESSEELRAALEYEIPRVANRGYQVLSVARVGPEQIPPGNDPWLHQIASNPHLVPVMVVVRDPEGREVRYLTLVTNQGRSARIVGLFD